MATPELPWSKHVLTPPAPPQNGSAKGHRPSSVTLGEQIAKLIKIARGESNASLDRVAGDLARKLLEENDLQGAQLVRREAGKGGPRVTRIESQCDAVEWLVSAPPDELVLDADCGRHLARLATELESTSKFIAQGIDAPTRVLFHGPSGTGKTLAARWLGNQLGLPVAVVKLDRIVGSHLGETARKVGEVFAEATKQPSVLFLDEIDGMSSNRASGSDSSASEEMRRATTAFLQQIDRCEPGQIIIAATNHPEQLDAALRRRISTEIGFSLPDSLARHVMASKWLARADTTPDALELLADVSDGLSGAHFRALTMASARIAIMAGVPMSVEHVRAARGAE